MDDLFQFWAVSVHTIYAEVFFMSTRKAVRYSVDNHALGMTPVPSLVDRTKGRFPGFPGTSFKRFHVNSCLAAMPET